MIVCSNKFMRPRLGFRSDRDKSESKWPHNKERYKCCEKQRYSIGGKPLRQPRLKIGDTEAKWRAQ